MSARTKLNDDGALVLTIPHSLAHQLELATGELPYLLGNAAGVFELLYDIHSAGFVEGPLQRVFAFRPPNPSESRYPV